MFSDLKKRKYPLKVFAPDKKKGRKERKERRRKVFIWTNQLPSELQSQLDASSSDGGSADDASTRVLKKRAFESE